jgi:hypothetical protein
VKTYELLTVMKEPLKRLSRKNVGISSVEYIEMFDEYREMADNGLKKTYIIVSLCEKYKVGRTKFLELIHSFEAEI